MLYRISARDNQVIEVRITTLPDAVAMRIDMPDRTYMLVNQAEHRMAMVVPEELMVMDLPYQAGVQDQFLLNNRMKFTRRGVDTVATVHCTSWDVLLDGNHATVCVTDEGVLLRSVSVDADGKRNTIEAISVSYTPAPASDFLPIWPDQAGTGAAGHRGHDATGRLPICLGAACCRGHGGGAGPAAVAAKPRRDRHLSDRGCGGVRHPRRH